ncbi:hypothetical protein FOZ62_005583, partial [Perkinsus olseni]
CPWGSRVGEEAGEGNSDLCIFPNEESSEGVVEYKAEERPSGAGGGLHSRRLGDSVPTQVRTGFESLVGAAPESACT